MSRVCAKCQTPKPLGDFGWKNKQLGTLDAYCKPCRREYNREHYTTNKTLYFARNDRAVERLRAFLRELKSRPCTDCKRSYPPCVMDFDHRDPALKTAQVGQLINRYGSKKRLLEEIAKCDLLCANCHRLRTCKRDHDHARKA